MTEAAPTESIQQYVEQLAQVEQALAATDDPGERANLESLKRDLTELLQLTQETIEHEQELKQTTANPSDMDEEFALFMSEINAESSIPPEKPPEEAPAAADMLKELVGSKCSAPHTHKWGSKSHHNALVCSLDTTDEAEIMVKVLFINPTHQEMVPCSYFLEGDCRFSDEKCRFSHGEVVPFAELKDYREPRFELLRKKGTTVLVKQKNRLWVKGTIREADFEGKTCTIQLEESKREVDLPFEDILPLEDSSDKLDDSDSGSDEENDAAAIRQAEIITRSLLNPAPTQRLGEWERHTKGIGSKIMQKMGYVVGAGLGCRGEGIVVPVSAQVLPQGRSLDYCMELRERANGDKDLFSVEKKILRQRRIQERKEAKQLARSKEKKRDVFSFINSDILGSGEGPSTSKTTSTRNNQLDLPSCSSKNLNIASLKLGEQTRRLQGDIEKLKHSLKRHQPGSQVHKSLQKQIADKRGEIALIQATECSISREQQLRTDKRKMTVF